MSDTFIATPSFTKNGTMIFGKNASREPNESQSIIRIPAMECPDKEVECSFISIPQVASTFEVILSRPFHQWGATMGVNEHGLVIGNQPVYTKVEFTKTNQGLSGMDMLRLALERCKKAETAMEFVIKLLEEYGQDVHSGYKNEEEFHHYSFIFGDTKDAYLLETAGKAWAAVKIEGFRHISNGLTLEQNYAWSSKNLVENAHKNKWVKKGKEFSFKEAYGNKKLARLEREAKRRAQVEEWITPLKRNFRVEDAINILSSHHIPEKSFNPSKSSEKSICRHSTGRGELQTANSMVAEIRTGEKPSTCWFTGTSSPCLSIFKPFFVPGQNIYEGLFKEPGSIINKSLWWQGEQLNRLVSVNYKKSKEFLNKEREALQLEWLSEEKKLITQNSNAEILNMFSNKTLNLHIKRLMKWKFDLEKKPLSNSQFSPFFKSYVEKLNREITPIS